MLFRLDCTCLSQKLYTPDRSSRNSKFICLSRVTGVHLPPSPTMSAARKQAPRLARPAARYWKGKAPKGVVDVDSDSDAEEAGSPQEEGDIQIGGDQEIIDEDVKPRPTAKGMNVSLRDVNISKDGKVIVGGREESGRTAMEDEGSFHGC